MSSVEPRGDELIARYKANYGIPEGASITEDMILRHWNLEKQMRLELLSSTPEDRREVFERSYTRLYREFDWLNTLAGESDGVHLARIEPEAGYDVVVSDQVFEHLHPDDALVHLENTFAILRPGGRCILSTPHRAVGPVDVTRVFGHPEPLGMHLKEYSYGELARLFAAAGFDTSAVLRLPGLLRRALKTRPRISRSYLRYLILLEQPILAVGTHGVRLRAARAARTLLFDGDIVLVGRKPDQH